MKSFQIIVIMGLTVGFFACNSTADKHVNNIQDTRTTNSIIPLPDSSVSEQEVDNECVRAQAEPIIRKETYPNTTFTLQPDSTSAIETVVFDNGDKLIIRNEGCEYYVLTFRFETTQHQQDTTNLEYWFGAANQLMNGMLAGLDTPVDIKKGLVSLNNYVAKDKKNKYKNVKLGEEIDFGGSEIRSFVTVDSIQKVSDNKYAITISFAMGPL